MFCAYMIEVTAALMSMLQVPLCQRPMADPPTHSCEHCIALLQSLQMLCVLPCKPPCKASASVLVPFFGASAGGDLTTRSVTMSLPL